MKNINKTLFIILIAHFSFANNIQLTNVSVANNTANTGKVITFSVSWENSYNTANNQRDGAYVFFKFKNNDGTWHPLIFSNQDNVLPANVAINFGGGGDFSAATLYRNIEGSGNINWTNVRLGIVPVPGVLDVRGFALEMVFVNTGNFYVGDLSAGVGSINSYGSGSSNTANSKWIETAANIIMGTSPGNLYDPLDPTFSGTITGFPNGFNGFWIMKYELSQAGFRDFLNTMSLAQQTAFFPVAPTSPIGTTVFGGTNYQRLEIETAATATLTATIGCNADNDANFNETNDGEWVAMNNLSWYQVAAYLDWACMRPMTELEYEKACRGRVQSVPFEYAWGDTQLSSIVQTLGTANTATEFISNQDVTSGNANYQTTSAGARPYRNGIFANAFTDRKTSGGGYYGAMELSGNLVELCVTTANTAGRSFRSAHGDGLLSAAGSANEPYWPGIGNTSVSTPSAASGEVLSAAGVIARGGAFGTTNNTLMVSNRLSLLNTLGISTGYGIRGVRTF